MRSQLLSLAIAGLAAANPFSTLSKRSPEPELVDGKYLVSRQNGFDHHASWTFDGTELPTDLVKSGYTVGGTPGTHRYTADNVRVRDGYLELLVNGGQTVQPYTCGEVVTSIRNIKYASVRTVAILTEPAGVCNGMFFLYSNTQETDIEWLSDANSLSNGGTRKLWFTNQDADGSGENTHNTILPPSDVTSAEHEYRLDWTEGLVEWYLDGVKVWETTEDVPSVSGPWVWNNWSSGSPGWSVGPPAVDAIFKIRSIDMYYNVE